MNTFPEYALRGDQQDAHYVTCCSQVFDMDGGGMQFVAFEASNPSPTSLKHEEIGF